MRFVAETALVLIITTGLFPLHLRAQDWVSPGSDGLLFTGGGTSFATTNFALSVDPAWEDCRLQIGFGFATDETNSLSVFQDSFSLTLQTQDYLSTLLLLTADVNGVTWAPDNPGGLQLSPELLLREALSSDGTVSGYDMEYAFVVSLVLPSAFLGTTSMLYLDLFDNENALGSVGWLSYARLVPGTTTNTPPVLVMGDQSADEGVPVDITVCAFDTDVPMNHITYALITGPAGLSIDSESGVVNWTPGEAQGPGTHAVTVVATDDGIPALSATQSFQIVVQEVNVAPAFDGMASRRVQTGHELSFSVSATDADWPDQTLSFSLGGGAPEGATMTPAGAFQWTPETSQTGEYDIVVNVLDSGVPALGASSSFHVSVLGVGSLRAQRAAGNYQFLDVTNAVMDVLAQTVRVPVTSGFALYRLMNDRPTRITGIRVAGGEAVLTYVIQARNVTLKAAPRPGALFEEVVGAIVDEGAGTIRTSLSPGARFFRVSADVMTRVVGISTAGGEVLIRYEQIGESVP